LVHSAGKVPGSATAAVASRRGKAASRQDRSLFLQTEVGGRLSTRPSGYGEKTVNDTTFKTAVEAVAKAIDGAGVLALIVGLLLATVLFLRGLRGGDSEAAYKPYRQRIGRSILLSLEFLVAADIIRTVALEPTFRGVGVLAIVVLVRTFLSFTLEVELEGRWPWSRTRTAASARVPG
jgi:uncharacterized membrane protein